MLQRKRADANGQHRAHRGLPSQQLLQRAPGAGELNAARVRTARRARPLPSHR